jgi:hypothetical protein
VYMVATRCSPSRRRMRGSLIGLRRRSYVYPVSWLPRTTELPSRSEPLTNGVRDERVAAWVPVDAVGAIQHTHGLRHRMERRSRVNPRDLRAVQGGRDVASERPRAASDLARRIRHYNKQLGPHTGRDCRDPAKDRVEEHETVD